MSARLKSRSWPIVSRDANVAHPFRGKAQCIYSYCVLDDLGESSSSNQACQMQTARESIAESKNQNKV